MTPIGFEDPEFAKAVCESGFTLTDLNGLDIDEVSALAEGRAIADAVRRGVPISDAARSEGYSVPVANRLLVRYRARRAEVDQRHQIELF